LSAEALVAPSLRAQKNHPRVALDLRGN